MVVCSRLTAPFGPIRPPQARAGRGRQGDDEQCGPTAPAAGGGSADRADHRRSPPGWPVRSDRSCWGSRLRKAAGCSLAQPVPVASSPIAGWTRRLATGHDASMHHRPPAPRPGPLLAVALLLASALSATAAPAVAAADFPANDARYHTYAEMVAEIQAAQAAHPDIVVLRSIGKSYQGRDLWVAKVSDNVAADEAEPEVMFDGLHHAREHLSLEQNLAILRWLTDGLRHGPAGSPASSTPARSGSSSRSTRTAPSTTSPARRTAPGARTASRTPGSTAIGTDLNRNYGYHWACCGGSSASKSASTYHGSSAFSTPEARAIRDFMASRRIGGRQQIKTAITFHTAGAADPVAVRLHQDRRPVRHDHRRPRRARRPRQEDGRAPTATRRCSRAACTSPTATRSTGPTATSTSSCTRSRCTRATARSARPRGSTRPTRSSAAQTERNKDAILTLIEAAGCPYALIGKADANCGPLYDDFETLRRLDRQPARHRHGDGRRLAARQPADDRAPGRDRPVRARGRWSPGAKAGSQRQLLRRRRRRHDRALRPDRPAGDGRLADVPLLPRPQLELVVAPTTSGPTSSAPTGRGRWSARNAAPRTRTCRRGRRPAISMTPVGRADGPDRLRGRRPRSGEHRRGGRRRRPDHPP